MSSPASIAKHPIHPMVVPFPIALWIFSFICDVVYALDGGAHSGRTWRSSRWGAVLSVLSLPPFLVT
jgi:uncharacterized membrane protein